MSVEKVVIIGSGPAGLTAAIYAARAALQPLVIEGYNAGGLIPGGQLMFTTEVENYPGFPASITGPELMKAFRDQAERFGTRFVRDDVTEINLSQQPFTVKTHDLTAETHALIIATGARANWLGLETSSAWRRVAAAYPHVPSVTGPCRCIAIRKWSLSVVVIRPSRKAAI